MTIAGQAHAPNPTGTRLVLHVGLPKTGTTTLQRNVFAHLPCALVESSVPGHPWSRWGGVLDELRDAIRGQDADAFWPTGTGAELAGRVRALVADIADVQGRAVVSYEALSWPPYWEHGRGWYGCQHGDRHPLAAHLAGLLPQVDLDDVRLVVGVRRQASYLAALYAQDSPLERPAGQHGFERGLADLLRQQPVPDHLDLNALIRDLGEVVGPSRVTVLPVEMIRTARYWLSLAEVLNEPGLATRGRQLAAQPHNVRSIGPRSWQLRPPWPWVLYDSLLDRFPAGTWASRIATSRWNLPVRVSSRLLYDAQRLQPRHRVAGRIHLTPGFESRIMARYADSNRALATLTDLPLAEYGY